MPDIFAIPQKTDQFDMNRFVVENWRLAQQLFQRSMTCRGKECSGISEVTSVIPDMNTAKINTIISIVDAFQEIANIPTTIATDAIVLTFNPNTNFSNYYNTTMQLCCTSENELFYRSCWEINGSEQWTEWTLINSGIDFAEIEREIGSLSDTVEEHGNSLADIKSQLRLIEYDRASAIQNAYITSNGNVTVITEGQYYNAGYCASEYIDIAGITNLYMSATRRYALYDSTKTLISSAEEVTVNGGAKAISIPATAKYIRITVNEEIDGNFVIRQATKTESTKIAFVGDSITWGYNDNTNEQVEKPYPQIIKEEYGFAECYNMGIIGRTLGGDGVTHNDKKYGANPIIDTNYLSTIPTDADIIVIFAGTNDFGVENYYVPLGEFGDQSYMTFYGSLELLCKRLIPLTLGKKLILCTPLHRKAEIKIADSVTRNLADYATAIREVAEKYGVEVIDLYREGEFYAMLTAFQNQYTTSGLHPNQDWYYILARKIGDRIVSRLN